MGVDEFNIDVTEYEGIDVDRIAREEAFKAAVRTQNEWRDNLDQGTGATGSHGRSYRNTGEAINSVVVSPQSDDASEYVVGGDVVQLAVAEFGRVPTPNSPPPFDAIADWARERGLQPDGDQSFASMVDAIRWSIARNGLDGFAPGRLAAKEVGPTYRESVIERINDEIDRQSNG